MTRILQVSTSDVAGGAEAVAANLVRAYARRGHPAWLAVGYKRGNDPDILRIPLDLASGPWVRLWYGAARALNGIDGKSPRLAWLHGKIRTLAEPGHLLDWLHGVEDFHFPATWHLLDLPPERPDIVHCHNLHGRYFDLRALPWLSRQVPTVLTLHDAWLLSGHCAHSFDCDRWRTGCGRCPDLTIYPAVRKDATAFNWRRKREIFAKSRLYIATPSLWLMERVQQSILAPAIIDARVIPNGVDLTVFRPSDQGEARAQLGLPSRKRILLFVGNGVRGNRWKDYETMQRAVRLVAERMQTADVLLVALGEDAPPERAGRAEICFVPPIRDPNLVARYYQAADVYVHAALAENFPLTTLEALACGTPVVATSVGGIPEQVDDGRTGYLVPSRDPPAMAASIERVLTDEALRGEMGRRAAATAQQDFDLNRQVQSYLAWYAEILEGWRRPSRSN